MIFKSGRPAAGFRRRPARRPSPYAPPQARHAAADPFNFGYQTRQTAYDTRLATWMTHNTIQQLEHESAQREKLLSQQGQTLTDEGEQLRQDWMNDRKTIREMQARGYRPQQIAQVMSESLGKFDSRWSDQHVRKQPTPDELFQQHTVIHNGRLYGIGTRNGNVSITALEKGDKSEDFDKEYESAFKLLHGSMPADDAGNRRQPTPEEIEGHIRQKRQLRERMTQGGQQGQGGLAGQGGQHKPDPQQQQQQQQQSPDIWGSTGPALPIYIKDDAVFEQAMASGQLKPGMSFVGPDGKTRRIQ